MQALHRWFVASSVAGALTLALAPAIGAQAKPANATAQCKDGSYSEAKTERGACSGHGGVGTWYGATESDDKAAAKSAERRKMRARPRPAPGSLAPPLKRSRPPQCRPTIPRRRHQRVRPASARTALTLKRNPSVVRVRATEESGRGWPRRQLRPRPQQQRRIVPRRHHRRQGLPRTHLRRHSRLPRRRQRHRRVTSRRRPLGHPRMRQRSATTAHSAWPSSIEARAQDTRV